jgi:bifunctional N-acetylglucosamine-1-phosphate-uridyltransferase/glucosamine-1-phosphate-acetyltransferase GlmU-like protein
MLLIQVYNSSQPLKPIKVGDAASTGAGSIIYEHGTVHRLNTGA